MQGQNDHCPVRIHIKTPRGTAGTGQRGGISGWGQIDRSTNLTTKARGDTLAGRPNPRSFVKEKTFQKTRKSLNGEKSRAWRKDDQFENSIKKRSDYIKVKKKKKTR